MKCIFVYDKLKCGVCVFYFIVRKCLSIVHVSVSDGRVLSFPSKSVVTCIGSFVAWAEGLSVKILNSCGD